MMTAYEVRPCVNHLGGQTGWDICHPAEPGASGIAVVATVYESEEVARIMASAPSPDVWEAIERAPRDCEKLLLWCPKAGPMGKGAVVFGRTYGLEVRGEGMLGDWEFTHFMRLPDPPKVTVEPQDTDVTPTGSGYSAEPEPSCTVSAVPVSIPNANRLPSRDKPDKAPQHSASPAATAGAGHPKGEPATYRIDQHGPYGRWIVVRNGEDMSAHNTLAEAKARRAEAVKQGSVHEGAGRRHRPPTGQVTVEEDRA